MKTRKWIAAVMAVLLLVAGCGAKQEGELAVQRAEARPLESPYGQPDENTATVAAGANSFAFRLSAELVRDAGDGNFVCSPYSVWLPLAALLNATSDAQRAELLEALGAGGISEEDVNRAASRMLYSLTNEQERVYEADAHNPLQIANAIFVDRERALNSEFAQLFLDYYRGQAMRVDFSSGEAADAVNAWASENTDGLIDRIVEQFGDDTVAAIANAIYFSDRWEWEFSEDQTEEGVFTGPGGESMAQFMLREAERLRYYEDERLQAMPLEFLNGGALYILLPRDGDAAGLLGSLDAEAFADVQRGMELRRGKLLLPRFRIESGVMTLNDALEALGVPLLDAGMPALTGLIDGDAVFISEAVQKAMIEVDEKGTTAAAVTVMAMDAAAAWDPDPLEPFEMICDRPFVFILTARTYDGGSQILFTGVVNET